MDLLKLPVSIKNGKIFDWELNFACITVSRPVYRGGKKSDHIDNGLNLHVCKFILS